MLNRGTRYILAALEAIIGWEWLMSGGNKLFSGTFPQGLADTLQAGLSHISDVLYIKIINTIIMPHSVFYGYLIEWTEITIGMVLLTGALMLLGEPRVRGERQHNLAVGYSIAVIAVAFLGGFLNVNFHFWMGGWVFPTFNPSAPFNEAIDLDGLLPPFSLVIVIANIALIRALHQGPLFTHFSRKVRRQAEESEAKVEVAKA